MANYTFVDTNSVPASAGSLLPAEAMSYGGVWLEQAVPGYRTLQVTGRELLQAEAKVRTVEGTTGAQFLAKSYPPRTIKVRYKLSASSNRAFREAYNKLNGILDKDEVQIIFNDEADKYFVGTKIGNEEIEGGKNTVIGELEIFCSDPLKYATTQKQFTASVQGGVLKANVVNEGTAPAVLDYTVKMTDESGYLGIASQYGAMEYGCKEEADNEQYTVAVERANLTTLVNASHDRGMLYLSDLHKTYGSGCSMTTESVGGVNCLTLKSMSGSNSSKAVNNAIKTITLATSTNSFHATMGIEYYQNNAGQLGEIGFAFVGENNEMICGATAYKCDTAGYGASGEYFVHGGLRQWWGFQALNNTSKNPYASGSPTKGRLEVRKEGGTVRFYAWGCCHSFYVPEIANLKVKKIQVYIGQYNAGRPLISTLRIKEFSFKDLNGKAWRDVKNRFPTNSTLTISGEYGKFYVNNIEKPSEEVLGTDYFKAPPGETAIQFYVSPWCSAQPTVTVLMREAWL